MEKAAWMHTMPSNARLLHKRVISGVQIGSACGLGVGVSESVRTRFERRRLLQAATSCRRF